MGTSIRQPPSPGASSSSIASCRARMRAALPDQPYAQAAGALNIASRAGAVDVVLIDSTVPNAPHGEIDAGTLAWIDTTLAASTTRPALIFLHHPPFVT